MKTKKKTRVLSLLLSMIMIISMVPLGAFNLTASAVSSFTPRTTSPGRNGWYANYGHPNCVEYARCRASEILGYNLSIQSGVNGGHCFWDKYAGKNGFKCASSGNGVPKPGAIACWAGHVAIVEQVYGNTMVISEGHYSFHDTTKGSYRNTDFQGWSTGTWFTVRTMTFSSGGYPSGNNGTTFLGYIYLVDDTPQPPPVPTTPSITSISSANIAVNDSVTINWNAVSYATSYTVAIRANNDKVSQDINVGGETRYTYKLTGAYAYDFYVRANGQSESIKSSWSSKRTCTAHNPVTVTFKDWDNKEIQKTTVKYGGNATLPVLNPRKGYDFQGWEGTYTNVTNDSIVKAKYKIITYTVNFLDKNGKILKTEKVDYGNNATPPTNTNAPLGYEFYGWSSESYKNVYTDASNKTINVSAIYKWSNDDLPIICSITSAERKPDGYYVKFDLTNYDKSLTRGRAVVALKTAEGKLVDSAESTAFSIPIDSTKKDIEVYLPCDSCATKAEVLIVNSYSSGVPISEKKIATVVNAKNISEWSNIKPTADEQDIETRTVYSSRDKITTTGNTKTLQGYEWDGTYTSKTGNWSAWQDAYVAKVDFHVGNSYSREVQSQTTNIYSTRTLYCYYHFYKSGGGNHAYCPTSHAGGSWHQTNVLDSSMEFYGYSSCNSGYAKYRGPACPVCGATQYWFRSKNQDADAQTQTYVSGTKTQYRYRDTNYTYNFFKWSDWSNWTVDPIERIDGKREVKSETQYRNINSSAITENNSGVERTVNGNLDPALAGKQITLYVYGWIGASDFTNQYIGQSVIGADGSYSFTYKLLNEPTIESGDYTISIGIEGTTNLIEIGKIEAPIRKYTVNFYNWNGDIISTQIVEEGGYATPPENPEKEGYNFLGWDDSIVNITDNVDIKPVMKKKEFTVIYVDWMNQILEVDTVEYGDVLTPPEAEEVKGYDFIGWDAVEEGNSVVTDNMIVTAQYEKKEFSVRFLGFDGEVVRNDSVEYGDSVVPPELKTSEDGKIFIGWSNPESYNGVESDAYVVPVYYYEETASVPVASYESGEYDSNIQVTLSTDNSEDVIYYHINDNDGEEQIYTGPITISKTCSITYHASCLGKNDSDSDTKYYCINTADKMTDWMLENEFDFDSYNFIKVNTGKLSVNNTEKSLTMTSESTDTFTVPYSNSDIKQDGYMTLVPGETYRFTYNYDNLSETSADLRMFVFSFPTSRLIFEESSFLSFRKIADANESGTHTFTYTVPEDCPYTTFRFGTLTNGVTVKFSNLVVQNVNVPEDVVENADDYNIEKTTGYSYKDLTEVSKFSEIENLEKTGWHFDKTITTPFSNWQSEKIEQDNTIKGFTVDTRVTELDDSNIELSNSYKLEHYKYTDTSGKVCYAPKNVEGFDCVYETIMAEYSVMAGAIQTSDGTVIYYHADDDNETMWFNPVDCLTEYRSCYDVSTYHRWTAYSTEQSADTLRECRTADMFRYSNKNYHIVSVYSNFFEGKSDSFVEDNSPLDFNEYNNVYGYNLDGLFLDENGNVGLDESQKITESCTLYALYSPKTFKVTFKISGGGTLGKPQYVQYLDSATEPDTTILPGFVFAGWDKDFDCITEDTIITGKYVPVSEYAYIALNMANARMYQGNYIELKAVITPATLSKEEIIWSTSDSNVAVVDDTGLVKAVGEGSAVITATVVSSKEKASCTVTVDEDEGNNIILKANSKLGFDDAGYLRGIKKETTIADIKNEFKNSDLVFKNIDNEVLNDNDFIGTGSYVSIMNGDVVTDMVVCVETGDMNGDGKINNRDVALFCQYLVDKVTPADCQIIAMDVNGDGFVNNKDAAMLAQYLVGKATL